MDNYAYDPFNVEPNDYGLDAIKAVKRELERTGLQVVMSASRDYTYTDSAGVEQKAVTISEKFRLEATDGAGDRLAEYIRKKILPGTNTVVLHGGRLEVMRGMSIHQDDILIQVYMAFIDMPVVGKEADEQYLEDYVMTGEHVDLGVVMRALRHGYRVRRESWNPTTFIYLVPSSEFEVNRTPLLGIYPAGTKISYQEHIDIRTDDNQCAVWNAPQADLLATDWIICLKGA